MMFFFSIGTELERVGVVGLDLDGWRIGMQAIGLSGLGVGRCCCWSAGSGCDTPLQEEPARRRAGEGFVRGRSDA